MVGPRLLIDTRYNNITHQSIPRVPGSCKTLLLLVLCLKACQEATFRKKVVFLFWKDIQSLTKAGF